MSSDTVFTRKHVSSEGARESSAIAAREWLGPLVVGGLVLLFGLVNWYWLSINEVTYGWDRMDHLISTLNYNNILATISGASLFEAFAWSNYYPPLVHMVAVAGYKLFGVNEDVAAMMNLIYLAIFLSSVWYVGRRTGGLPIAVLATLIVASFPMIYVMSRYLYIDFALTCLVAASMATLLATERFTRRLPALLFGLALGASFLVKWTAAAFLAVPLLIILWRSDVVAELLRHPITNLRPDGRRLLASLIIGGMLAALWIWPAREVAQQQPLGLWLIPAFALLIAGTVYALLADRRDSVANAFGAGTVASMMVSLWYLPNIEFLGAFYINAYGKPTGREWGYDDYFTYVVTEQLGPFYSVVFLVAAVALVYVWWRRGGFSRLRELDDTTLLLLAWAVVPVLIFATRTSTIHSRYLMPFLPPFAVWIAMALWRLKPAALRAGAIALVMLFAWGQFAIISFPQLRPLRDDFTVPTPAGEVDVLAHGFSVQYPASGRTDPAYAITEDIRAIIEQKRQTMEREDVQLGLVVNTYQVHEKHFLYQIYTDFPDVRMRELARNWTGRPTYPQLFEMDFVLLDDTHTYRTSEESRRVTERILNTPDDLFNLAYREIERWMIPSGETITLYERRFESTEPGISPETYRMMLAEIGGHFGAGDVLVLTAPDQAYIMGLLMPVNTQADVVPLPADGMTPAEATEVIATLADDHERIFLFDRNSSMVDPNGQIAGWLRENAMPGPEFWFNELHVAAYVSAEPAQTPAQEINVTYDDLRVALHGATVERDRFEAGRALPVTLFWEVPAEEDPGGLKVFVQLIGPDGGLVAQRDTSLVAGAQSHALLIPRALSEGSYRLIAGLYNADTGERLTLPDGSDAIELVELTIDQ